MINAHEIWAAAQLAPGEGIKDGVDRIQTILNESLVVTDDMVRKAYNFCPTDLPTLDRYRWMARYINAELTKE